MTKFATIFAGASLLVLAACQPAANPGPNPPPAPVSPTEWQARVDGAYRVYVATKPMVEFGLSIEGASPEVVGVVHEAEGVIEQAFPVIRAAPDVTAQKDALSRVSNSLQLLHPLVVTAIAKLSPDDQRKALASLALLEATIEGLRAILTPAA